MPYVWTEPDVFLPEGTVGYTGPTVYYSYGESGMSGRMMFWYQVNDRDEGWMEFDIRDIADALNISCGALRPDHIGILMEAGDNLRDILVANDFWREGVG